ncbi:nucleoporin NUP188 [Protopterus annectens]|uniref:nucleoporin NUP188 n=1 Tax=Protopterus annectens TaxID=7888 RepID=UPI001CFB8673|nr:nucleoporin NUP188 [Protopterus annectens]
MKMAAGDVSRSNRGLWTILLGRSILRESGQIKAELDRHQSRLLDGLSYYKPPSTSSAEKLKANNVIAAPLKEFGLRISTLLGLDELQSVELLECYLHEDYRGTVNSLKSVMQDERQSQNLLLKIADYYYEERMYILRCVLHLLTYFQDERHPHRVRIAGCLDELHKKLTSPEPLDRKALQDLGKLEAPTEDVNGSLLTKERQVSRWFMQCLREQCLLLEVIFLYYAYFEMAPRDLLEFAQLFKEQGFGSRQMNRHLIDESMDPLVDRIGYFSALILVEGMDLDTLHKLALEDCIGKHQYATDHEVCQAMDRIVLTLVDISHHAPVLLGWALLRHTLNPDELNHAVRRMGSAAIQLDVFRYITCMLKAFGSGENNCTASTARLCIYGLMSFVLISFEEHTLGDQQYVIDAACEVLAGPSLAELFWDTVPTEGLGVLLDSTCGMFPHQISQLLQLLAALVSDRSTAKKVYSFLDQMSFYMEFYKHKPNDVISHEDETLWRRLTPKLLYPLAIGQSNLRMPQGTVGQVMPNEQGYLVRWDYTYSCWKLFTCEIEMLLHVVSTADVIQHCKRVKPIIDLVYKVICTDYSIADCLLPITSRIYMLLQRLTCIISPPVDVIASCVNCLTALATWRPAKVWSDLHHTGFLPFFATSVSGLTYNSSGEGMNAGNYGNLLIGVEQPQGEYSITTAFLHLITTLIKGRLGEMQNHGLIPSVIFVLQEMLPNYHKWRYNTYGVREQIGCLILELIHAILNLYSEEEWENRASSLQSLCIRSLSNTDAGQALVNIMGIGVDTIDFVMATQSSSGETEGPGQLLIQTVKLAFSITNNVIRLRAPSDMVSPLEHALTQHGAHGNNLIAVLAKYIYHKHDPALPRLAIQLLKRLATVAPMSVYACLGSDAVAIRDAFLRRLRSKIEDMKIKVMILEFLTVAVETQPGLIELFLNLEVKEESEGSKEFILGEWSCLQVVLQLIDSQQQRRYWCPPLLHRAAIAFLHALWQDRRDSALTVLRTFCTLETCAFIMKIICLETYYVVSGSLDESLKDTLKRFSTDERYSYWSSYVKSLVCYVAKSEGKGCSSLMEYKMLISAWRMLLIVAMTHKDVMNLTDSKVWQQLFLDILHGTETLLLVPMSAVCLRLGSMFATLLLIFLKEWKRELVPVSEVLEPLIKILESILQMDQQMVEKIKARIFSVIMSVLQVKPLTVSDIPQYQQLLLITCTTIKEEAVTLLDHTRYAVKSEEACESPDHRDSMETDAPVRTVHKDEKDGMCVLAFHLAKQLCETDEDGDSCLKIVKSIPLLPSVLDALEFSLRVKQNLHFTEAVLHFFLTLARTQQGAAAIARTGVSHSICLPLLSVYQLTNNGTVQILSSSRKSLDAPSWPGVYCLCVSLMERLLKTLGYTFLSDALDFVGVHQERILQCLNAVRTVQSCSCLDEADHTVGFILQLSNFSKEWNFHLPQLLQDVQVNLCYLCQACSFLLHSRKILQHYLRTKNGDALPSAVGPRPQRTPQTPQTPSKQPTSETVEAEQKALQMVQYSLLRILSKTIASLRHFTPDICQILLDQCLDLADYKVLFVVSFTTPTFDADVAPSFGTLFATVNVALSMLGEIDKKKEPLSQSLTSLTHSEDTASLKSLIKFIMENCFYVLISQAVRYLRDPSVHPRDKQRMKQELSSELSTLLTSLSRYSRRGVPTSPAGALLTSAASRSGPESQEPLFKLVQAFVRHVQR